MNTEVKDSPQTDKNKNLFWVSVMSFCWSTSTIMIFSVLPVYLTKVLGLSKSSLGLMEGLAISLSFFTKFFSGAFSDWIKSRKKLILVGTVLTVMVRPLFIVAGTSSTIFWGRLIDRFGKGIRSAPTDALVADLSREELRGRGFGLRQALYTLGSVVGSILTIIVLRLYPESYQLLFSLASIIAFLSLIILLFKVKDTEKIEFESKRKKHHFDWRQIKEFPKSFWGFLIVVFFMMLTRFSEMFLNLRAFDLGLDTAYIPLLIITMDFVHSFVAFPLGKLSDKFNRLHFLAFTIIFLFISNLFFAFSNHLFSFWFGLFFLGVHMGASQGLLRAITVKSIPYELRGTAFSFFYLVSGFSIFITNSVVGRMAQTFGNFSPFIFGGFFALVSLVIVLFLALTTERGSR